MQRDDLIKKLMTETSNLSNTELETLILRAKRLSMSDLEIGTKVRIKHNSISDLVQGYVPGGPSRLIEPEEQGSLLIKILAQILPEEVEAIVVEKGGYSRPRSLL